MKILAAAAVFMLLAGPAQAQGMNLMAPDLPKDPVAEQKRLESERAYKAATQKIPDQKVVTDPWGNMRGTPEAKPNPPAKPRTPAR